MSVSAIFNQNFYLTNNADVVVAISQGNFGSALDHYSQFGGKELRAPNATFDPNYYAINNGDVLNAVSSGVFPSVFAHYQAFGETENRAPTSGFASFDSAGYLAANTDVAAAVTAGTFSSALDHFIGFGQNESRAGSGITAVTNPGTTSTLTIGVDTFSGTANADSFQGQMDATASLNTAGLLDSIDGGAGTDSIVLVNTTANAVSTQLQGSNITNVESLDYRASGGGNLDFDTAGSVTNFTLTNITSTSDFSDVRQSDTISFVNGGATMNSTVTYNGTDVDNAADSHAATLNGMQDGSELDFAGAVETFALTTSGNASRMDLLRFDAATTSVSIAAGANLTVDDDFRAAGATSLTITGAGNVDLTAAAGAANDLSALTSVVAGDATGNISLLIDDARNQTITTGSGTDTVNLSGTLNNNDTIDLGAGNDTLIADLDGLSAGAADLSISNVETLRLTDTDANAGAIQMDNLAFTTIRLDGDAAGDNTGTITLTDLAVATNTFTMNGTGAAGTEFFNGLTVDYDTTTTQSNATLTVGNGGTDSTDILVTRFNIDRVETLTVTVSDIGTAAANEATFDGFEGDHFTDLVVVADGELVITDVDGAVMDTLDLSGANGGMNVTITDSSTAVAVTLGTGNDVFVQNDTAGGLTIATGTGDDTVTGAAAAVDNLTLGTGQDTVISNDFENVDVVTDFSVGTDRYQLDLSIFNTAAEITNAVTADLVAGGNASIAAGNFLLAEELSAAETIADTDQLLVITGTNAATSAAALDLVEAGGARALTMGTVLEDDDAMLLLHSDGTDWTLSTFRLEGGDQGAVALANGEAVIVDLVTFTGLGAISAGSYDNTMFELIA
jgi:hypothetical protein